jgi:hypothetical protein
VSVIFWKVLTAACLLWYVSITVYVAVRGFGDIKRMLREIGRKGKSKE